MAINWDVFLELNAVGAMRRMEAENERRTTDGGSSAVIGGGNKDVGGNRSGCAGAEACSRG